MFVFARHMDTIVSADLHIIKFEASRGDRQREWAEAGVGSAQSVIPTNKGRNRNRERLPDSSMTARAAPCQAKAPTAPGQILSAGTGHPRPRWRLFTAQRGMFIAECCICPEKLMPCQITQKLALAGSRGLIFIKITWSRGYLPGLHKAHAQCVLDTVLPGVPITETAANGSDNGH